MEDLSLHILDIAENGYRANAKCILVKICERDETGTLTLTIENDGDKMDEAEIKRALDPFYTTKPGKKTGMGLALLAQSAQQTGGSLTIESDAGKTRVTAKFHANHPDMPPLGDIAETTLVMVTGYTGTRIILEFDKNGEISVFDSHQASLNDNDSSERIEHDQI